MFLQLRERVGVRLPPPDDDTDTATNRGLSDIAELRYIVQGRTNGAPMASEACWFAICLLAYECLSRKKPYD